MSAEDRARDGERGDAEDDAEREAAVERAEVELDEAEQGVEALGEHARHAPDRDAFEGVADRFAVAEARLRAARERLEAARDAYHEARSQARHEHRAEREREREARRAEREVEREERRRERHERRERHGMRAAFGFGARALGFDLGDLVGDGEEHSEEVHGTFTVGGMATLRVRNVSGETTVAAGEEGVVRIRATKRVRVAASAEKARRLLQNIEVRMEQHRDEVSVTPHLFEQDRSWLDLFRGGRVTVDIHVIVPREARVDADTASGDLTIAGTRGPVEAQSVSGDVLVSDVQGPLWLKTVSGDARCERYVGYAELNSVSGDVTVDRSRLRDLDVVTVSGDVAIAGELEAGREHRVKTISGDVRLDLPESAYDISFKTMSGDLRSPGEASVAREGRKDRRIVLAGPGETTRLHVKTVSGDLTLRRTPTDAPSEDARAGDAGEAPIAAAAPAPAPPREPEPPGTDVRDVLDRLARGEIDVDAAVAAIDDAKGGRR